MTELNERALDLIDRYLLNELGEEELNELEQLRKNPVFQQELAFREQLMQIVEEQEDVSLKNLLQEEERQILATSKPSVAKRRSLPFHWLSLAATLALLLIAAWWLMQDNTIDSDTVIADYFEPYRNTVLPIERGEQLQTLEQRAFFAYENGDFQESVDLFQDLMRTGTLNYNWYFYQANTYLALDQSEEALNLLSAIPSTHPFYDLSLYYKALTLIDLDQETEAKAVLSQYLDSESLFKRDEVLKFLEVIE